MSVLRVCAESPMETRSEAAVVGYGDEAGIERVGGGGIGVVEASAGPGGVADDSLVCEVDGGDVGRWRMGRRVVQGENCEGVSRDPRLVGLAAQVRRLQRRHRVCDKARRCASGLAELDEVLGGGFVRGGVHELVAAREGAAAYTVALRTAARAASANKWLFYVDVGQDLYPPALAQMGVPLGRLIVVRTAWLTDALWVCEQVLRCRGVGAVVLPVRKLDAYVSRRLQLAAEAGEGLGLLIRREADGGQIFAASRLYFEPMIGGKGSRRMRVSVLKLREGRPCEPFVVELPDAADFMSVAAGPIDRAGPACYRASG